MILDSISAGKALLQVMKHRKQKHNTRLNEIKTSMKSKDNTRSQIEYYKTSMKITQAKIDEINTIVRTSQDLMSE